MNFKLCLFAKTVKSKKECKTVDKLSVGWPHTKYCGNAPIYSAVRAPYDKNDAGIYFIARQHATML